MSKILSMAKEAAMRRYRVVVIKCPYDTIASDLTCTLLGKVVRLKIESYRELYPYGMLPVDAFDFVGDHFLACEQTPEGLEPVMGFKTLTLGLAEKFVLEYPALHYIDKERYPAHFQAVAEVLDRSRNQGHELGYYGSWTIAPRLRSQRAIAKVMQDLTTAFVVRAAEIGGFEHALSIAVTRFKVENYHRFWGWQGLVADGQPLPGFVSAAGMGEQCSVSMLSPPGFSADARRVADEYAQFWDDRLEIRATPAVRTETEAA